MKKITILLLAIGLAVGIGTGTVHAAEPSGNVVQGAEANKNARVGATDLSAATTITMGNTINDSITTSKRERVYKFSIPKSGRITLDMTSYMKYYCIHLYNSDGERIWYTCYNTWNDSLKYRKDAYEIDLIKGTYYIRVTGYKTADDYGESTGTYILKTKFSDSGESYGEPNNEFSKAVPININSTLKGQIAINDTCDVYKFSLSKAGRVNLNMTSYMQYYCIHIYDSNGMRVWYTSYNTWNENLKYCQDAYSVDLKAGYYYIRVTGYKTADDYGESTGNYVLQTSFLDSKENINEPNNDFSTACALNFNSMINGQIALNDRYDVFKFSLSNNTDVKLNITSYMQYYSVCVYNSAGKALWYTDYNTWNENVKYRTDIHKISLAAGSYYLKVTGYRTVNDYGESTGNYTFSLGTFAPISNATVASIKDVTYTGSARKPKVTVKYNGNTLKNGVDYTLQYKNNYSIGKATVIITGIGNYSGEKQVNFKIVPKKVKIKSAKNTAKRTVTVTWKTDSSVTGYEVYRSTKKKSGFKKIKKLKKSYYYGIKNYKLKKKKTYYYKVRAYKIVDGKKYYGAFSKVKSVKIKK